MSLSGSTLIAPSTAHRLSTAPTMHSCGIFVTSNVNWTLKSSVWKMNSIWSWSIPLISSTRHIRSHKRTSCKSWEMLLLMIQRAKKSRSFSTACTKMTQFADVGVWNLSKRAMKLSRERLLRRRDIVSSLSEWQVIKKECGTRNWSRVGSSDKITCSDSFLTLFITNLF